MANALPSPWVLGEGLAVGAAPMDALGVSPSQHPLRDRGNARPAAKSAWKWGGTHTQPVGYHFGEQGGCYAEMQQCSALPTPPWRNGPWGVSGRKNGFLPTPPPPPKKIVSLSFLYGD